jgi:carbonic anhydrase/acetyltransferase-like protein (isoleucine patch superfamily)
LKVFKGKIMPLYALDGIAPEMPESNNYWLAPDAHVIGKVRLGQNVGIWFGAVLRGDNELIDIGAGSNIQEGACLHTDLGFSLTMGKGCTIGHHAILHGCTLGDNVLIGMGATILNGAKIGKNSIVGAGALVTENKEFPEGSLIVGSPAKAIRLLDDAAIAALRSSAHNYVANWQRFAKGLKLIA